MNSHTVKIREKYEEEAVLYSAESHTRRENPKKRI